MRIMLLLTLIVVLSVSNGRLDGEADSDLFTFVRLKYRGELTRLSSWRVDWPASDRNFIYQPQQTDKHFGRAARKDY